MRILFANKFWFCSGGVERVMFDEIAWLEAAGHETAHFATASVRNAYSPWARYFPPLEDLANPTDRPLVEQMRTAVRLVRNRRAAELFGQLVNDFRPDVVHAHAIHRQLSPSVLLVAAAAGIPVVETVHDHHHTCPGDLLLRGDGEVCAPQLCRPGWYLPAITHRCMKSQTAVSAVAAFEVYAQSVTHAYERSVSAYVCPSRFMLDRVQSQGWRAPCVHIPNAVKPDVPGDVREDYVVFVGRLSREKGVELLLRAAKQAAIRLVIVGDGPLKDRVQATPGVEWHGWLPEEEMRSYVRRARVAVLPSLCFENAPLAVLEAMSMGVPVIASDIGGVGEIISHMETGMLVQPGDEAQLAQALRQAIDAPDLMLSMGERAREETSRRFSPSQHVTQLERLYERVRDQASAGSK